MTKQSKALKKLRSETALPVFPSGIEYDAMPAGAKTTHVLWKNPAGGMRFLNGRTVEWPEEMLPCDLELAIETEANMRLLAIIQSGKSPTAQDYERCATKPPMTGRRLFDLLFRFGDHHNQSARAGVIALRQERTSKARRVKMKKARTWGDEARKIANGNNPKTGKPWRNQEQAIKHLEEKYNKSRSAIVRVIKPPKK